MSAESNRKSLKEILEALQAALTAATLDNVLIVAGAGTASVNGRYVRDDSGDYVHTVTESHTISGSGDNWVLYISENAAYSTMDGLTGSWSSSGGEDGGDEPAPTVTIPPAFESVKIFDVNSLESAIKQLLAYKSRLCFIIPDTERFETEIDSGNLLMSRVQPVALLISDSIIGDRQKALFGSTTNPGANALKEIAMKAVTGQLIENPGGIICKPTASAIYHAGDSDKKLPSRSCIELDVDCVGGTLEAALGVGPNL